MLSSLGSVRSMERDAVSNLSAASWVYGGVDLSYRGAT